MSGSKAPDFDAYGLQKQESYEKLEMEVIAFDKIHMDTSSTSGIAVDDREDADEGIWTGYY